MDQDLDYLKRFVRQHPDNQMGWYLLGKAYAEQGKEGKANYCFANAGDIYEAFEKKSVPVKLPEPQHEAAEETRARKRFSMATAVRALTVAAIIALLLTYPAEPIPNSSDHIPSHEVQVAASEPFMPESEVGVFYMETVHKPGELNGALTEIIFPQTKKTKYSVVAKAPSSPDGKWILWWKDPAVLLSAERLDDTGKIDVAYHDAETCVCTPTDGTRARQVTTDWMRQQEQLAVLRSASQSFLQKNGTLPGKPEELAKPYPNNVLPGLTEAMKTAYPLMAAAWTESGTPTQSGSEKAAANASNGSGGQPNEGQTPLQAPLQAPIQVPLQAPLQVPLQVPLEIIVDKNTHRLALVSGNVILRSYAVGLGGDRTPEREFVISEKVRNPKGKKAGEFGSRGMTLSDTDFAIHGTTQPDSIGKDRSLGCVRMLQEDLEELYDMVPSGTKVSIRKGGLPEETGGRSRFVLVPLSDDTNPGKIYKWLN